jgi:hypothetical protein
MSANSAVTVLRSPSITSVAGIASLNWTDVDCALDGARGADAPIAAPHSPQNLSFGSIGAPHFGQVATRDVPQLVQNLRPSRLSLPHFEQRIIPPASVLLAQLIEQCFRIFEIGGIESFGEPVVDFREHSARLIAPLLARQQPRKAGYRTQFPRFGLLTAG